MTISPRTVALLADADSNIEWQETACLLCGGENWSPLVEAPDPIPDAAGRWFMVVQCRDCGLCFTNPRPSPDSMAQFYSGNYRPHRPIGADSAGTRWWQRLRPWARLQHWRKSLPLRGQGRLLDFGCGGGAYLLRMRRQGWNVVGIDACETVVQQLRGSFGLPALAGSLPNAELAEESFDVITMWHSLEHTHEPLDVLRAAQQLLSSGGKLIVAVPNIDSCAFRWFGQSWNALDLPRHLVHFDPWTLRLMLHRAGFRQIRVRMQRRSGWLRDSARRAVELHARVNWWRRRLQGRTISNFAGWYAYLTRQSDCMIAEAIKK
jgi:SAM-dependent methyltransferase